MGYLVQSWIRESGETRPLKVAVSQIIDGRRMIITHAAPPNYAREQASYYLEGFDTADFIHGNEFELTDTPIILMGMKSDSDLGSVTPYVQPMYWLQPAPPGGPSFDELVYDAMDARHQWQHDAEIWVDRAGKTLRAVFVNRTNKAVVLSEFDSRADVSVEKVYPISVFRDADQMRIREYPVAHPVRTWTNKEGTHRTEASFVSFENNQLILERTDGARVAVRSSQLSADDQSWLRDYLSYLNADPLKHAIKVYRRRMIVARSRAESRARRSRMRQRAEASRTAAISRLRSLHKAGEAIIGQGVSGVNRAARGAEDTVRRNHRGR